MRIGPTSLPFLGLLVVALVGCRGHASQDSTTTAPVVESPVASEPVADSAEPAPPVPEEAADAQLDRYMLRRAKRAALREQGHRLATGELACSVADDNIARTTAAILAAPAPATQRAHRPWKRRGRLQRLPLVRQRLALSKRELARLRRDGLLVLEREAHESYAFAFHEIYQSQLPVYISVDAVLHAVFAGHDQFLSEFEERSAAQLSQVLADMHRALPDRAPAFPGPVARDLDLYLMVARTLLAGQAVPSALANRDDAAKSQRLVQRARAADELAAIELFGRRRMVDFTRYQPRGHYTTPPRAHYFRAVMWLSRLEFNLVSRDSASSSPELHPAETPREVQLALAILDLAEAAGALPRLAAIEGVFGALGGVREDVSLTQLAELRARAGVGDIRAPDASERLRAAIGTGFRRTARVHFTPEGVAELPVIASVLGMRIPADTSASRRLVHDEVPNRGLLGALDIAYLLGHDRALHHMGDELREFSGLRGQLQRARSQLVAGVRADRSLAGAWMRAVQALADPPAGSLPYYSASAAYRDLRLNSAIVGYGQIRHNHVLLAGQGYDAYGCAIPDGFVEPAKPVWDALAAYADQGAALARSLNRDANSDDWAVGYFERVGRIARVLSRISERELANLPLTEQQQHFLGMVAEMREGGSDGVPWYTGWYFDLFHKRVGDGLKQADFVADFHTSTNERTVAYVGATRPRLGVFVVDTAGPPRVVVGPVARGYQTEGPLARRLDNEAASQLPDSRRADPWADSYTVAAGRAPDLVLQYQPGDVDDDGQPAAEGWTVRADKRVGAVSFELLDHHRQPLARARARVKAGTRTLRFKPLKRARRPAAADADQDGASAGGMAESVYVHFGDYHRIFELDVITGDASTFYLGAMRPPEEEY